MALFRESLRTSLTSQQSFDDCEPRRDTSLDGHTSHQFHIERWGHVAGNTDKTGSLLHLDTSVPAHRKQIKCLLAGSTDCFQNLERMHIAVSPVATVALQAWWQDQIWILIHHDCEALVLLPGRSRLGTHASRLADRRGGSSALSNSSHHECPLPGNIAFFRN